MTVGDCSGVVLIYRAPRRKLTAMMIEHIIKSLYEVKDKYTCLLFTFNWTYNYVELQNKALHIINIAFRIQGNVKYKY